jgi:lysophospholipase L1-like esterase
MSNQLSIGVVGDSVAWGQGLLPEHKYAYLVGAHFGQPPDVTVTMAAHSGAVIGARATKTQPSAYGEIPLSFPTILEQIRNFPDPDGVDLVLMNGGINDVDIRTILSPLTNRNDLHNDTMEACYTDVKTLLNEAIGTFTKATRRFIFTGYYPILSSQSDLLRISPLLNLLGVALPPYLHQGPLLQYVVSLALQFWHDSEDAFKLAIAEVRDGLHLGDRLQYVSSPFTESNAVFAPNPWLFGITDTLEPQDEVIEQRVAQCDLYFSSPFDLAAREECHRASAGHPNVSGAQQFANTIIAVLG